MCTVKGEKKKELAVYPDSKKGKSSASPEENLPPKKTLRNKVSHTLNIF